MQVLAPGSGSRYANVGVPGLAATPAVNGRGLAAADYDNNGTVDVAVNSVGGRLVLLRNSGEKGHWLEVKLSTFAPGRGGDGGPPGRPHARRRGARGQQLPLLRGSAAPLRARRARPRCARSSSASPAGGRRRLSNVRADRVVVVHPPAARPAAPKPATSYAALELHEPCDAGALGRADLERRAARGRSRERTTRPSRRATSSTSPRRCGTRGTRTRRRGRAISSPRRHRAADVHRRPECGDQLRRVPAPPLARLLRLERGAGLRPPDGHHEARSATSPTSRAREGDSPAALGNRIAAAAIAYGKNDGSLESRHYLDPSYTPAERAAGRLPARHADARRGRSGSRSHSARS